MQENTWARLRESSKHQAASQAAYLHYSDFPLTPLLRSRRWPSHPSRRTGGARCPKVLTCGSRRTATQPPTGPHPPWPPPPRTPPSRPPLPPPRRRPGARLVLQASYHLSDMYRDEIYSLQILLSRTKQSQAEQVSKSKKKFHQTTYKG